VYKRVKEKSKQKLELKGRFDTQKFLKKKKSNNKIKFFCKPENNMKNVLYFCY
jgi:hypothetical protein